MKQTYAVLLRGINVGGKNKVPMAELKRYLERLGCTDVTTYIASGNAVASSDKTAIQLQSAIEQSLPKQFELDSELVCVLVLTHVQLQAIVDDKPAGFGEDPATYYSDVIFLMGIDSAEAMPVFTPRKGVDMVWQGNGVVYSQRLGSQRTKSRLNRIIGTVPYQSMTIRTWNTTVKLLALLESVRLSD